MKKISLIIVVNVYMLFIKARAGYKALKVEIGLGYAHHLKDRQQKQAERLR